MSKISWDGEVSKWGLCLACPLARACRERGPRAGCALRAHGASAGGERKQCWRQSDYPIRVEIG